MRINYVLIDYENVQPKNIEALNKEHYKVIVFYGSNQVKFKSELVTAIQEMRDRAEYIKIDGNGKNALDFHIAFYIGQLAEQNPKSFFHIISKDTGYDPLIKHLKSKNILACRSIDISEMPKPTQICNVCQQYSLKLDLYDVKVREIRGNEAEVEFCQKTVKLAGPEFRNNIITGVHTFRKVAGSWKLSSTKIISTRYLLLE